MIVHFLKSQLKAFAQKNLYQCFGEVMNYTRPFVALNIPMLLANHLIITENTIKAECYTLNTRDSLTGLMTFAFIYFNPKLIKDGWFFWGIDRINIPEIHGTLILNEIVYTDNMIQANVVGVGIIKLYYRPSFPFCSTYDSKVLDQEAMFHAALGFPSKGSLGKITEFDDTQKLTPRLPNHELLCVSEIQNIQEKSCTSFYHHVQDIPFVLFLEAALQPCGWFAFYNQSYRYLQGDVHIRNLEGTITFHEKHVLNKTLRFDVQMMSEIPLKVTYSVIMKFKIKGYIDEVHVCTVETVFGYFEKKALQKPGRVEVPVFTHSQNELHPVMKHPFSIVDRIVHQSENIVHGKRMISPDDFYFKGHFLGDPVQPGSLGLQAFIDLLGKDYLTMKSMSWKYRGQVMPHHNDVDFIVVKNESCDEGFLIVDQEPIYSAKMVF